MLVRQENDQKHVKLSIILVFNKKTYLCRAFLFKFFLALGVNVFCLADIIVSRLFGLEERSVPFWAFPFVAKELFVECLPAVLMPPPVSMWFGTGKLVSLESSFVCDSVSLCLSTKIQWNPVFNVYWVATFAHAVRKRVKEFTIVQIKF